MLLNDAFAGTDVFYITTLHGLAERNHLKDVYVVRDFNRQTPVNALISAVQLMRIVFKLRPHYVFSTGAAPGLICMLFAKLLGAKVIWIDSVANAEKLSMSGSMAKVFADVHLSQWPKVAEKFKSRYEGSVL
ncbi:MAG: glucuronosyltransferase [Rhizobiaceae bacterium]|nr:glucuronosyltransferase [Rhizobiaceae bacterium]MCZ8352368.1 glucuronosyltransferase [Rhizobium sp.]